MSYLNPTIQEESLLDDARRSMVFCGWCKDELVSLADIESGLHDVCAKQMIMELQEDEQRRHAEPPQTDYLLKHL